VTTSLLVNLTWLRPGRVGGTERYAVDLVRALSAPLAEHDWDVVLACDPTFASAYPDVADKHEVANVPGLFGGAGRAGRVLAEQTWLARLGGQDTLVHHLGGTAARSRGPSVVTIYDVQFATHPEFFSSVKRKFLAAAVPAAIRRADAICVMSDFVARELTEHFGADPESIVVVPPALVCDGPVMVASSSEDRSPEAAVPLVGVAPPYVLFPAMTWQHKNHEVLLRAMSSEAISKSSLKLVFTGGEGPSHEAVVARIGDLGLSDRVTHLGRVDEATLDCLYRGAVALVFPSLHEGFGQPVSEAMLRGCPVLAASAGALPEVVGAGGQLVPPDEPDAWATSMLQLMDPQVRALWVDAGYARSRAWSPERTAGAQLVAYELALLRGAN
jgi:glycosyltransferase involved in cell wall biosynthesis